MKSCFMSLLLKIKMLIDHFIEGFSNGFKVLFLVSELGLKSPKELCDVLNMAKSNLASLANELKNDNFLVQEKCEDNKKRIYYKVTPLGKQKLEEKIAEIKIDSKEKAELIEKIQLLISK